MKQKLTYVGHAETETSLAVIRSLGKRGVPIIASGNSRTAKGLWSKYVKQRLIAPSTKDPQKFVDWLIEIAKKYKIEVFLPVGDDYMWIASHYYDVLSEHMKIPTASKEIIDITLLKDQTYKTCENHDIPCPKTYFIKSIDEVKKIAKEIDYPVMVKSRISFGVTPRIKGILVNNERELLDAYVLSKPAEYLAGYDNIEYPLIQEFIPGKMQNLYTVGLFMNKKSEPIAIFCGRKIRQLPVDAGSCCMAECSYDEEAIRYSVNFLQKIKWYGVAEVEIKKNETTGEFNLIEVNPRPYSWIWLAVQCGLDMPYLWYRSVFEEVNDKLTTSRGDLAYVYYLRDMNWVINQIGGSKNKIEFLKNYRHSLKRRKTHAVWDKEDMKPFFMDYIYFILSILRSKSEEKSAP